MGSNPRLDCPVTDNLVGTFITYNFNLLLATTDSLILYMHVRFYRLKGEDTNLQ